MFSLADQILKFQNTVLTLPDNVMTIDQRFLGGGIKMQDLIQENSFIITQMRKFKAVFLNYCKLNDKIYHKIIEHEVNANEHFNKIFAISSSIDRRVQQSDRQMKKIKQDIFGQMFSIRESLQKLQKNTKQGLIMKVNQEGFEMRVKKLVEQYEQQNATSSYPSDNQGLTPLPGTGTVEGGFSAVAGGIGGGKRKGRGLTLQDIQVFKAQITPLIDDTNKRIDTQAIRINQLNSSFNQHTTKILKADQQIKWLSDDILSTRKQIQEVKTFIKEEDQNLLRILRETINQNIWMQRFQIFKERVVRRQIDTLSDKFYKNVVQMRKDIQQNVKPKFVQISGNMHKMREKQKMLQTKITKNQQKFGQISTKIDSTKQQILKQVSESNKKHEKSHIIQLDAIKSSIEFQSSKIKNINQQIQSLVSTTQQAVLKKVQQKLGKQMKQVRGQIVSLNRKTSEINNNVKVNKEQVGYVKDIVSTKANFTDLVMYFDKKADKQDVQDMLHEFAAIDSPKNQYDKSFTYEQGFKDITQHKRSQKRSRRSSYSKRVTTPLYTKPEQDPNRYLLVGWQSPQNKQTQKSSLKNGSSKIRNKSLRPSTANTLFML